MDRRVNQNQFRVAGLEVLQPWCRVGGTVVYYPEHAAGIVVGWPGYDLPDHTIKGLDAVLCLAASKDPGMMDIQCRNAAPGLAAKVLVLGHSRITFQSLGDINEQSNREFGRGLEAGDGHPA